MNNKVEEQLWIHRVKIDGDSVALNNLVKKYQPMIENAYKHYYVKSYDRDDWYQEAMLVCYQSCRLFDGTTGSKFGSFYKMKFKHHIIDLIRRENANKRKINGFTEELKSHHYNMITAPSYKLAVELVDHIKKITGDLTTLELLALRFVFGEITLDEGCNLANCNVQKFRRTVHNLKKRIFSFGNPDLS